MRRESLVGQDESRPVVVKKESKCGERERPFRCPEREGERKETERTVAQGEGIIRVKEFPQSHTA